MNPFIGVIVGPIFAAMLGVISAFTYNRLPRGRIRSWSASRKKGMVLALIVWIILFLVAVQTGLSTGMWFSELSDYVTLQIFMTFWAAWPFILVLGQQLGNYWDKFGPK